MENTSFSETVLRQLCLLQNSRRLLSVLIVGLLLQLNSLGVQEKMLVQSVCCPDSFSAENFPDTNLMQLASSLITLYSTYNFSVQSQYVACTGTPEAPGDQLEPLFGKIVTLIAAVRFYRLASRYSPTDEESTSSSPQSRCTPPRPQTPSHPGGTEESTLEPQG